MFNFRLRPFLPALLGLLLVAALPLSGCATLQGWLSTPSSSAAVQTATMLAVGEAVLTGKTADEQKQIAVNIIAVTTAVQGALNGDQTTVASLLALVQVKVLALKLPPQQALAANTLLAFVSAELQARVDKGVLAPTDLVVVNTFAGYIIAAAKPYAAS